MPKYSPGSSDCVIYEQRVANYCCIETHNRYIKLCNQEDAIAKFIFRTWIRYSIKLRRQSIIICQIWNLYYMCLCVPNWTVAHNWYKLTRAYFLWHPKMNWNHYVFWGTLWHYKYKWDKYISWSSIFFTWSAIHKSNWTPTLVGQTILNGPQDGVLLVGAESSEIIVGQVE